MVSVLVTTPLDVTKTRLQMSSRNELVGLRHALRTVVAESGPLALWRGTQVALVNAMPTVGVYLYLYDNITLRLKQSQDISPHLVPLAAGVSARSLAVALSTPLEFMRVRLQSQTGATASHGVLTSRFWAQLDVHRMLRSFWPYLMRDVPFSAIYWSEPTSPRARARVAFEYHLDSATNTHSCYPLVLPQVL
jgi:hypothetical protein